MCLLWGIRGGVPVPPESPTKTDPAALALSDAARLLSRVGGWPVTEAMLEADVASGAPVNPDGTLHLVRYSAWLVRQMGLTKQDPGDGG